MRTTWRPEEFRTFSRGPRLDRPQFGSDTPRRDCAANSGPDTSIAIQVRSDKRPGCRGPATSGPLVATRLLSPESWAGPTRGASGPQCGPLAPRAGPATHHAGPSTRVGKGVEAVRGCGRP